MSRKIEHEEPFKAPSSEEILKVVNSLGGKSDVSRICKKNWNTVDRWCKGSVKIDFANWKLISESEKPKKSGKSVHYSTGVIDIKK